MSALLSSVPRWRPPVPRRPSRPGPAARAGLRRWAALGLTTLVVGLALGAAGLPSAALFAALAVAVVFALAGWAPTAAPGWTSTGAQAVLGVLIGALVQRDTLASLAEDWLPVVLVSVATLVLSVAAGLLLGLHRDVDPLTGSLALTAGGASGLTAISRELGADDRLVAVVQYLRVALVISLMPAVTAVVFHPDGGAGPTTTAAGAPWWADLGFLAVCAGVGVPLARLVRLPAGGLLGPMLVAAALSLAGWSAGATSPALLVAAAYAVIGWQAGLGFTRASLRALGRVLPLAVGLILLVVLVCAALGLLLARLTGVSELDAYLATTPGGLYAVLATAVDSGSDVTFVLAVQVVRVFLMLLLAPALARGLHRVLSRRAAA